TCAGRTRAFLRRRAGRLADLDHDAVDHERGGDRRLEIGAEPVPHGALARGQPHAATVGAFDRDLAEPAGENVATDPAPEPFPGLPPIHYRRQVGAPPRARASLACARTRRVLTRRVSKGWVVTSDHLFTLV